MNLDIRYPLGLIFLAIGGVMAIYGVFTRANTALYAISEGMNINLIWGVIMVLFGALMVLLAKRAERNPPPALDVEHTDTPRRPSMH